MSVKARDLKREEDICNLYKSGNSTSKICSLYNVSRQRVQQILKRNEISYKNCFLEPRVELIKQALENCEVNEVIKKYKPNRTIKKSILEKYNINLEKEKGKINDTQAQSFLLYNQGFTAKQIKEVLGLKIQIKSIYACVKNVDKAALSKRKEMVDRQFNVFLEIKKLKESGKSDKEIEKILLESGIKNVKYNEPITYRMVDYIYKKYKNVSR